MNIYRSISTIVYVNCIEYYGWKRKYLSTLRPLVPIVVMPSVKFVPSTMTEYKGIQRWWVVWRIGDDRWWAFLCPVFHWSYNFDEYYCENTWLCSAYYWVLIIGVESAKKDSFFLCWYYICTVPINHVGFQRPMLNMYSESIVYIALNYILKSIHFIIREYDRFIHLDVIQC